MLRYFQYNLEEALNLSKLPSDSREYRRSVNKLIQKKYIDPEYLDYPEKQHWERVHWRWGLIACGYFALYIAGLLLFSWNFSQVSDEPISDAGFWLIMAGFLVFYLLMVPMFYACIQQRKLIRQHVRSAIESIGAQLQPLSAEEFEDLDLLVHNLPPYICGEPTQFFDACGCYNCGCIFPAESVDWDDIEQPVCPDCGSHRLVFATKEVPVSKKSLQILHNLFIEE